MKGTTYKIVRSLAYLQIQHPQKEYFDWWLPCIATIISLLYIYLFTNINTFFATNNLADKISTFIQILPGFYVAALAAIATFNNVDIDQTMPPPTPKVKIQIRGQNNIIKLTRRRFLSMLFAFLTAESIILCILCNVFTSANLLRLNLPKPIAYFENDLFWRVSGIIVIVFLFWQLIITTFLGLYYLGDRLHQPNT